MLFDLQLVPLCVWVGPFTGLGLPDRGRCRALTLAMSQLVPRCVTLVHCWLVLQARLTLPISGILYMLPALLGCMFIMTFFDAEAFNQDIGQWDTPQFTHWLAIWTKL